MTHNVNKNVATLPAAPGVYLFKNAAGNVLYVGKAKSLRSRVRSYFRLPRTKKLPTTHYQLQTNQALGPAKQQMIPRIADIEIITTDTETEALILEANLIRRHQPPYNVVLRDDKYYLFIKITTSEVYPRVYPVRRIGRDKKARYLGPYSSAAAVRQTLRLLRRIFPHRAEKDDPREKIFPHPLFARSAKSAHRSLGEGGLPRSTYEQNIANVIRFLKGDRDEITNTLRTGMHTAAARRQFEQAAIFRDQLRAIERLEGAQKVHLPRRESFDVISLKPGRAAANVFAVRQGKLINKSTFLLTHRATTAPADILRQFLLQYYLVAQDIPPHVFIPTHLSDEETITAWLQRQHQSRGMENHLTFTVPRRGLKKQLLIMGETNARQLLTQEEAMLTTAAAARSTAARLAQVLAAPTPLHRIETYDISNLQGQLATGAMVVFTHGRPDKAQYRKFRLQLSAPDDYAMLQQVLRRRFTHLSAARGHKDRPWPKPDLILIDGGKGQLNATRLALRELSLDIPLAALAKREEELFVPGRPTPIRLNPSDPALHLLQRMRDEAHRFTLTYHRLLRQKRATRSLLDEISGIGPKRKQQLLAAFGSLKAIRAATEAELTAAIGPVAARSLRNHL